MPGGIPGGGGSQAGHWRWKPILGLGEGFWIEEKLKKKVQAETRIRRNTEAGQDGRPGTRQTGQVSVLGLGLQGEICEPLKPFPPSEASKASASNSRTPTQLHHQLLPAPEVLLAPATYRPFPYQDLYPGAPGHIGIPRARLAPYPLPNIGPDGDQEDPTLPAKLGLLSSSALCLEPSQHAQ